jgi:hypothetical protein
MMDSVAPIWDGNETWLVLGGIGLFAAFPLAFAIIIPACHFSRLKDFAGVRSDFSVWFPLLGGTTWVRSFFATAPGT